MTDASLFLRADARRNREALLAVAREVVAESGTEASLRDVARRAGVGIGTLYRHFPTREALLEAVLRDGLDELNADADRLLAESSPGAALVAWLARFAEGAGSFHGLPASVLAALGDGESELHASCVAVHSSAARLLERAQEFGEIRPDVDAADVVVAASAIGWAAENSSPERAAKIMRLLADGLFAGAPKE
jgi:AcrR family transcriptional regulator